MVKDNGEAFGPISDKDPRGFSDLFPTDTKGDGCLRPNNVRTGAAQGKGGFKRKVRCQQCGFLTNLNAVDYSGGSLDGAGAGGQITDTNDVGYDNQGTAITEAGGNQALKKGAGCPFCFSKNSSKTRNITQAPTPRPKIGF
jgi:hypothetical protein